MERRAILAAVLCLVVLVVYQEALQYFYPAPPPGADVPVVSRSPELPSVAARSQDSATPPEEVAPVDGGEEVTVDTDLFQARISTAGGRITSLQLKKYRQAIGTDSPPLEMIEVSPGAARPLGVRLFSEDGRKLEDDTQVVYAADSPTLDVRDGASAALTLHGVLPSGTEIEKVLTFSGNAYPIEVDIRVRGSQPWARIGVSWRHHIQAPIHGDPEANYRGTAVLTDKTVVHELATTIATAAPHTYEPPLRWVGYADHYFLAALVPSDPAQSRATVSPESGGVQLLIVSPLKKATDASAHFTLYVGPKDVELLEQSAHELSRAVDFGWFSFLAAPLLRLLKLFHSLTGNYGVDIILLTILVKVLFIPLTNRSMKSMRDMQRLQPQMVKLREKFKDDREQLNKEMIELYRRHRVNPLGGCLPMLLQFPVFIGLYQALSQAIELRHAKFAFWVHDLSAHECYPWPGGTATGCNDFSPFGIPIPILVLLMGGSMILQQYLSPSTGMDPTQQRMMLILMPVMFTVMFINFPSGLVVYWLVNNVLTIGQQWWTNRAPA